MRSQKPTKLNQIFFAVLVTGVLVFSLFPFYWAVVTSLRRGSELFSTEFFPHHPAWENYTAIFLEQPFGRNLLNSIGVAAGTVFISQALGLLAAFALSRLTFRGRSFLLYSFLSVSMFPQIAVLSGLFEVIRTLRLYNTWSGLTFAYTLFTLPFTVWILTTFMKEVPKEIEEAAVLDGASPLAILWYVFLPVLAPSLVTAGLLAFIAAWNEFLFALTLTLSEKARTVPVAIALMGGSSQYELPWGRIMAASVTVTLPIVALTLFFQKRIVTGLTAGSVKG